MSDVNRNQRVTQDATVDDFDWSEVTKDIRTTAELLRQAVNQGKFPNQGAPEYDANSLLVPADGTPYPLVGYDLTRIKARFTSDKPVLVGKRTVLASGQGYPIYANGTFTFESTDEIYIVNPVANGTFATVGVFQEKMSQ